MFEVNNISKIIIGVLLFVCGIMDIKSKNISLIVVGLASFSLILILPFSNQVTVLSGFLGTLVGVFIIFLSKITRGQIGMGDGVILLATGLGLGLWNNIELLIYALFLSSLFSMCLLIFHLADRKKTIPFIPFLFISYIGVLFG